MVRIGTLLVGLLLALPGMAVAQDTTEPDIRVLLIGDDSNACMGDTNCVTIVGHYATLAINSGLYEDGWYINEGNWTDGTTTSSSPPVRRQLRGADESLEHEFDERLLEEIPSHRRLSCSWCIKHYGSAQACLFYTGMQCRRRRLQMGNDAEIVRAIRDSCYRDIGVDFDLWVYSVMKWLADMHNAHSIIEGITYRVQERKTNTHCTTSA